MDRPDYRTNVDACDQVCGGLTRGRGFKESVRHFWVLSLNSSAFMSNALMELTGTLYQSSDHVELGNSRRKRDFNDCQKFYMWLQSRNPFLIESENLFSLSTRLVSIVEMDDINCERSEEIGRL